MKRESVVTELELDCWKADISALITGLVSLFIIIVCSASHVLLGSSISAWWAFCLRPGGVKPRIKCSSYLPIRWFSHAVRALPSASGGVGHLLSTNVFILCICLLIFSSGCFFKFSAEIRNWYCFFPSLNRAINCVFISSHVNAASSESNNSAAAPRRTEPKRDFLRSWYTVWMLFSLTAGLLPNEKLIFFLF